jgi:hypothetical protein
MQSHDLIATLRAARVVPVVRTSTAAHAATAVGWLRDAGIRIFEITTTIPDAPALIRELVSDSSLSARARWATERRLNFAWKPGRGSLSRPGWIRRCQHRAATPGRC